MQKKAHASNVYMYGSAHFTYIEERVEEGSRRLPPGTVGPSDIAAP